MKVMMTHLVTIRWSARYEVIHAMKTGFQGVIQTLNSLTSVSENLQTWKDAQIILVLIENFFMSHLLYSEEIHGQINHIQKKLQEPSIGLVMCVIHMNAIKIFFNRNGVWIL